ncbi:MAG: dihydrolipoyl dehydrogenase [Chitinispirillaceae bacterium]|nr:dihydrolipoyl dehydrogenase [Chitinispirillaceae bacterium]
MSLYDCIILGAGPAGYLAAERAGAAGLNTVLIEKDRLGGVCLNAGCIPSKTILHSAKLYDQAKHAQSFGVIASNVMFDLAAVMARKEKIVETLRKGIAATLKKHHVTVETGEGTILSGQNKLFRVKVNGRIVEGTRLLVCTGSEAVRLPIPGAEQKFVYTNREILSIGFIPKDLVVVGGGVIGLEIAAFFAEVGSPVTVIELLPSIGGPIDAGIALILQKELEKKGVTFRLSAKVTAVGDHTVSFEADGQNQSVKADIVLMSVGRRPVTKGIGLENLNVYVENGAIRTDERGRTSVPGVWAAGDVNGVSMLAHTAFREAEVCVNDMLQKKDRMRYAAVPAVIYTHPEVATVGLTKADAEKRGLAVETAKLPLTYSGRYLAENEGGRGVCMVVVDKEYKTLLGVHMVGGTCSEMIFGAAAMIENELRVDDIKKIVFPHPTVSEIIKETIGSM